MLFWPLRRFSRRFLRVPVADVRRGANIRYDGQIFTVNAVTSQQGGRGCRTFLFQAKPIDSDSVASIRANAGESMEVVLLKERNFRFLYEDGESVYLLEDGENPSEVSIPRARLHHRLYPTLESGQLLKGRVLVEEVGAERQAPAFIDLPRTVVCTVKSVAECGDGDKQSVAATLESGFQLKCPTFVKRGDRITLDSERGFCYLGVAK